MPARTETSLLSVDESKYLAVVNPYPLNANFGHYPDQRALALWLACCAGKEVLRAMFYRPSVSPTKPFFYLALYLIKQPTRASHKVSRNGRYRGQSRV